MPENAGIAAAIGSVQTAMLFSFKPQEALTCLPRGAALQAGIRRARKRLGIKISLCGPLRSLRLEKCELTQFFEHSPAISRPQPQP